MSKAAPIPPEPASLMLSPSEAQPAPAAAPAANGAVQPLIYACSGCSSAAQLTNHLAVRMDRAGLAEMSCIVGLGGDVKSLVRVAESGRPIVMLDGCPLQCGKHTLARHGLAPAVHWELSRMGVRKLKHVDFNPDDAARLAPELVQAIKAVAPDAPASSQPSSP